MRQASRRSWRIGQTRPVRVVFHVLPEYAPGRRAEAGSQEAVEFARRRGRASGGRSGGLRRRRRRSDDGASMQGSQRGVGCRRRGRPRRVVLSGCWGSPASPYAATTRPTVYLAAETPLRHHPMAAATLMESLLRWTDKIAARRHHSYALDPAQPVHFYSAVFTAGLKLNLVSNLCK